MKFVRFLLIALLFLTGCAYLGYLKDPFTDIAAFSKVINNIYRGGYPKESGYEILNELGIKTIVNLSNNAEKFNLQQKYADKYGFKIIHIPLSIYERPKDIEAIKFLEAVLNPANHPVFVHCTSGRDRTGAMIAVYRVIVEKKGPKEGYKEAIRHGFWPYRGEVVLKDYIHQLKDRKALYEFVEEYEK